jgi:hypothetical protein
VKPVPNYGALLYESRLLMSQAVEVSDKLL